MNHVMLDLETLGNGNEASIISIGACRFNPMRPGKIEDSFHVAVCADSSTRIGLKIDASTVMWWLHADRQAAREQLAQHERMDIMIALDGFAQWIGEDPVVWGNGATFDNVILRNAYRLAGLPCPWMFYNDRCYRTFKALAPSVKLQREGTHHDALHDAISQAKHMQAIVKFLRLDTV